MSETKPNGDGTMSDLKAELQRLHVETAERVVCEHLKLGFAECCNRPPIVTEWRPGCWGVECGTCGKVMGSGQIRREELMQKWNAAMTERGSCADCPHGDNCAQTKAEDCPWIALLTARFWACTYSAKTPCAPGAGITRNESNNP